MTDLGDTEANDGRNDKPPKCHWEAAPKERFFDLKFSHYVEIILTAALVGIAYFQYTVYNRQAGIMTHQADISEAQNRIIVADQRAWLKSTLILNQLRFRDNKDAELSYSFSTKNVGKSPATNIRQRIIVKATTEDSAINSIPDQKSQCELARKDAMGSPSPGAILFPGEDAETVPGALNIASNGSTIVSHETYRSAWPRPDYLGFQIIGCLDYGLPSGEHGQSGFSYSVERKMPNGAVGAFPTVPGVVNRDEILFLRDFFSGGYFQ